MLQLNSVMIPTILVNNSTKKSEIQTINCFYFKYKGQEVQAID